MSRRSGPGHRRGRAEAGDDLVEDEDGSGSRARLAQRLEEARLGQDGAGVVEDGLEDDRRDRVAFLGQRIPDAGRIVVLANDDEVADRRAGMPAEAAMGVGMAPSSSVAKW